MIEPRGEVSVGDRPAAQFPDSPDRDGAGWGASSPTATNAASVMTAIGMIRYVMKSVV